MSQHWREGSRGADWKRVRLLVLERDGYRCRLQLPGCTTVASHAHHTRSRSMVGDDPRYIVASCPHCNQSLGDPTRVPDTRPRRHTRW